MNKKIICQHCSTEFVEASEWCPECGKSKNYDEKINLERSNPMPVFDEDKLKLRSNRSPNKEYRVPAPNHNMLALAILVSTVILVVGLYMTFAGKKAAEKECTVAATVESVATLQPDPNAKDIFGGNTGRLGNGGGFRAHLYDECMTKRGF